MEYNSAKGEKASVNIRDGMITEISEGFSSLTSYSMSELIGKSYLEISHTMKFDLQLELTCIKDKYDIYLFTKLLEPREVVVSVKRGKNKNDVILIFEEKENTRLERKLPYVEQLYLANNSGIAIYSAPDLILLKANQKYIGYLNKPFNISENCIGKRFDEIVKGFKGSIAEEIWTSITSTGKAFYASNVMYDRYDRGITYWDSSIVPIHEDGKVKYLIDNSIEVTERVAYRKLVEEQTPIIKRQNKEIEAIIALADENINIFDKNGECIRLSKFLKELFEVYNVKNINELKDKYIILDSDEKEITFANNVFNKLCKGEEINNYKGIIQKENTKKYVVMNGKAIFDELGNRGIYILMTNDITDVMQSKIIEEQKSELEAVIENMNDAIYITDREGKMIVVNAEARKIRYKPNMVAFAGDYANTTKMLDMTGNEIDIENMPLKSALRGEIRKNQIIVMRQPDKEYIQRVNSTPIYDTNGDLIMALACSHDITDLIEKEKIIIEKYKELELLKQEADSANKVKSLFLANMSHEIRTPMNGVIATIQLLQSTILSTEQSKYIKMLKDSSDILLAIINNILDISKIEAGTFKLNKETFNLKEAINSIYSNLLTSGNAKGLEVSYYFDPIIECSVIGDEVRLNQILNNLVSNAVKFTKDGYISFRITRISSKNDCEKIKFMIKDTGIGIEESFKGEIFNIFSQGDISVNKKYIGAGLGLAISKQLAILMEGELEVESVVGQGSTFSFTCELKKSTQKIHIKSEKNPVNEEPKSSQSKKDKVILCVEDNLINQEVMESIAKRRGYEYIAAYNGNEALDLLKNNQVDLILMDVQMPELNGFETTKIIRERESDGKHIPIIAMTAYAMFGDKDKCIDTEMDTYISKPFDLEKLHYLFEFYLD